MKIHQKLAQGNLNFSKNWVQWIGRISTSMQTIDLIAGIPNIKNAVRQSKRQVFLRKKKRGTGLGRQCGRDDSRTHQTV
jgi:hypothetical protein